MTPVGPVGGTTEWGSTICQRLRLRRLLQSPVLLLVLLVLLVLLRRIRLPHPR